MSHILTPWWLKYHMFQILTLRVLDYYISPISIFLGRGGGAGAVVKAACFESHRSRVRTPLSPWPRGNVLGLRLPGLEFQILCLEDSFIAFISPSSEGSPGPV